MSRFLVTYEVISEKVNSIGYKLITNKNELEKINAKTKFKVKCNKNHTYKTSWEYLKRGNICTYCSGSRISIETVKEFNEQQELDFILLSEAYNIGEKLKFLCSHGHEFEIFWDKLKNGQGCSECRYRKISEALMLPEDECLNILNTDGYIFNKWLEEFRGVKTSCELTCPNKHLWRTTPDYFKSGNRCKECHFDNNKGENHPNWKGGLTPELAKIRQSNDYTKWRLSVFNRDNYTCQCCGENSGGNLNAHHIENFSVNEHLRFDIDNGITLCNNCHNPNIQGSFHHTYGTRNNNREQLEEYIKNKQFNKILVNT